jgi:hypothetical protein
LSAVPAVFGQSSDKPVADPPAILVGAIADTRAQNFHSVPIASGLGVELTLRVGYTDAIGIPSAYGHWRIHQAIDDLGDDLTPPQPSKQELPATTQDLQKALENLHDGAAVNASYTTLSPSYLQQMKDTGDKDFEVKLQLGSPKRRAKKITRLSGDFTIYAGGRQATVSMEKLTRYYGRQLDDPALAKPWSTPGMQAVHRMKRSIRTRIR